MNIYQKKVRCTKLRDWINVITLFFKKTLKESMIDKKINEKESEQLKQCYNHCIDKNTEKLKKNSIQS